MEAVRKLTVDIMSYLKGDGFKKLENEIDKSKKGFLGIESLSASTFLKMGAGIFSITKLMGEYNKSIQAAQYQMEQETKLYSTMKGQGFREEQIESIKAYASELQNIGIIGDEVTLAGAQQLATYNLTEKSLKALMPAMQDIMVQQKGLSATGGDALKAANMLAKGLLGQTGELKQAGITLNARQEQLIKTGTQEQKVAALVEAVTMNVGEQNKAFAATPEGKIVQVQNRIGDMYENVGFRLRKSRYEWFSFLGDNLDGAEKFVMAGLDTLEMLKDGAMGAAKGIYKAFTDMPEDVRTTIKLIAGFLAITTFPVTAAVGVILDIVGAFNGQKSVTEDAFNALMKYLDYDYNFEGLKKDVKELWQAFDEGGWVAAFLHNLQTSIGLIGDGLVVIAGVGKGLITGDYSLAKKGLDKGIDRWTDNQDYLGKFIETKRDIPSLSVKVPVGADGIDYNKPLLNSTKPYINIPKEKDFVEQEVYRKYLGETSKIEPLVQDVNYNVTPFKPNIDKKIIQEVQQIPVGENKFKIEPEIGKIEIPKLQPLNLDPGLKNNFEKKETHVNFKFEQKNETKIEGSPLSKAELEDVITRVNKKNNNTGFATALKNMYGEGINNV
ncbi:hypothetical protein ABF215_13820 [Fusobacterium sp. THCT13E1]